MVSQFLDFVKRSPTAFHAIQALSAGLEASGFSALSERDPWSLAPGGRYFVTRNGSSLIAFLVPKSDAPDHFQIAASHSDSPMLKLKPSFESPSLEHYVRLNVEKYGGMLYAPWFDRPLSIAGRVIVKSGNRLTAKLVDLNRDAVMIPNMPIHFNREVNDGYAYNPQIDLMPLFGDFASRGGLRQEIAGLADAEEADIAGCDLFVYNRQPGSVWGVHGEYFSAPRIDDLECAFTSAEAFRQLRDAPSIAVLAVFDNEEVGSATKQGAGSTFLTDVLNRIGAALGWADDKTRAAISGSFMVSADNAHAVHPNHPEKYDEQNRVWMNEGVVIKHNANQKYTTDAVSRAVYADILARADVPVQEFANRSDIPGGSTLGNIANTHASMNTVDIGLAQLAMHSCYETAGTQDLNHMINGFAAFWRADIHTLKDGEIEIR